MLNTFKIEDYYSIKEYGYQLTAYEKYGMIDEEQALDDLVIHQWIDDMDTDDQVTLWNEFQEYINGDDYICEFTEEFFHTYFDNNPMEAARAAYFGDLDWRDSYIKFTNGNLESLSGPDFSWLYHDIDFTNYVTENYLEYDKEFVCNAVNEAYKLVSVGY